MPRLAESDAADPAVSAGWREFAGTSLRSLSQRLHPHGRLNLALQGGGAHGAFTWGVLDHLLEDGRIHIEAISGTSAGAMRRLSGLA